MWVCMYFRIFAQGLCLCLCNDVHTQRVSMCVRLHTCTCTRRSHFWCVYICVYVHRVWAGVYVVTYIHTEIVCPCVHTCVYVHKGVCFVYICVYVDGVYMDVCTWNDSQCVYTCEGYGLRCKCEQM